MYFTFQLSALVSQDNRRFHSSGMLIGLTIYTVAHKNGNL